MQKTDRTETTKNTTSRDAVKNTKIKDNGAKLIFRDPVLCAQFLRGYTDIELLKDVQPEDIEDITEQFLPLLQEARDSDSVKKIHLKGNSDIDTLYVIALIEHQTKVDFDMSFRILRYIVYILTDYASEMEKIHEGITSTKRSDIRLYCPLYFMMELNAGRLLLILRIGPLSPISLECIFQAFSTLLFLFPSSQIRSSLTSRTNCL